MRVFIIHLFLFLGMIYATAFRVIDTFQIYNFFVRQSLTYPLLDRRQVIIQ